MPKRALAVLALIAAQPALAALSPYYDSAEKITAILGDAAVADAVRQAPIGAISNSGTTKDGRDIWTVRVQDCDLTVHLTAVLPQGPGKTTYLVELAGPCS
ncbi:hypothetical protein [Gemmobacter denitrificans]|uniref:Uncharacterized protein n=1 Tax=Gemmobacter denitrificans TaxID=3123040 RepID=A0ABU8BPL7_9RHOB